MERLTEKCWRNLDPWECCGQDKYCQRGCHDEGGCTNGCKVPKIYCKLAKYEDLEKQCIDENQCGLRELLSKWKAFFDDIAELYDYRKAEEQGLLVEVIHCKDCKHFCGGGLWDNGHWCGRTARPGECDRVTENDFCSKAESALAEKGGV